MPRPTPPGNPIDLLVRIAGQLRCLDDAALADWLEGAVLRHIEDGTSLDHALGLAGTLGRSPRFEVLRRVRDQHLKDALWHLGGNFIALAQEAERYALRLASVWRHRAEPAPEWSPARKAVHAAFQTGLRVPQTADGMRKALLPAD